MISAVGDLKDWQEKEWVDGQIDRIIETLQIFKQGRTDEINDVFNLLHSDIHQIYNTNESVLLSKEQHDKIVQKAPQCLM